MDLCRSSKILETTTNLIVANNCWSLRSSQPSNALGFRDKADSLLWVFEDQEL